MIALSVALGLTAGCASPGGTPMTVPDEVAGAGKCSVVFMDGGAGNYAALDFPGGSYNASYQLDR